jgi:hypothetical protein
MDIKEFRSSFTGELAKPSRFKVTIDLPKSLPANIDSRTLSLRCENAALPGRTLATLDHRIYGPTEKYPYQSTYDDISLTFICDSNMIEKAAFDAWMEKINPSTGWNFEYKEKYATKITITQYDNGKNEVHKVHLIDAFPVAINQLDLDWSSDAPYHKLTVTFAYHYWESESAEVKYQAAASVNSPFNIAAALQIGALAVNAGQALKSGNPYALLGVAGAATSIIPSLGGTKTLSSVINNAGRGNLDTALDQGASKLNADKLTIGGLTSTNKFKF